MISCPELHKRLTEELPKLYNCFDNDPYLTISTPYWYDGSESIRVFIRQLESKLYRVTDLGETSRWLSIFSPDPIWDIYINRIATISKLYGVKCTNSEIIYADVKEEFVAQAIERVSQAAKDIFSLRFFSSLVPATRDYFTSDVQDDLKKIAPELMYINFPVNYQVDDEFKLITLDMYFPESKNIIQPIRVTNAEKVMCTSLAYKQIMNEKSIGRRVVVFDHKEPAEYKGTLNGYVTDIMYKVGTGDPIKHSQYLNKLKKMAMA